MYLIDPKTNKPSPTLTMMIVAFGVICFCAIFGGSSIITEHISIVIPSFKDVWELLLIASGTYAVRKGTAAKYGEDEVLINPAQEEDIEFSATEEGQGD